MGWVRIDDAFYDHHKFAEAGPLGAALWLAGLAYSNRNLTDGLISASVSRRLLDLDGLHWRAWDGELMGSCEDVDPNDLARHLVLAGLWEDAPGGYRIHDYHDYQPSAADVRASRDANAARKAAWRARHNGSHSGTDDRTDSGTDTVTPRPVPPPPKPKPKPKPNPKTKEKKTSPSSAAANAAFAAFWNAYPRKVGKLDARKIWDRRTQDTDPDAITAAAVRLAADPNLEPEFTPHPSTWLSRGGWDDDPLPTRGGNGIAPSDQRAAANLALLAQYAEAEQRQEITQ